MEETLSAIESEKAFSRNPVPDAPEGHKLRVRKDIAITEPINGIDIINRITLEEKRG